MIPGADLARRGQDPFDALAPAYDRTLPPHVTAHYLNQRVRFMCERIKSGPVLDVGCGTGALAEKLLSKGYQVIGTDASVGMLQVYRSRTASVPVAALSHALPFPSDTFQGAVSVALLHHIADAERVRSSLGEIHRVVRRGGLLVIWDHNPANPYWPVLMKKVPQDSGQERLIPRAEIRQGLRLAGAGSIAVFNKGFVPDFIPPALLPLMRWVEAGLEGLPLFRRLAAHNVVVVRKN